MRKLLSAFIGMNLFVMCVVQVSHAHRFYASFTQIDIRDKTQSIEIIHRLFTHDVEDYLRTKLGNSSSLSDQEIEPILKEYIEKNFALFDDQGRRLSLDWVGMEYEIDNVHIYQEAPMPDNPSKYSIINRLFMDIFEEQKNTVNMEWHDQIKTRIFVKGQEQQLVEF